ncbi:MAG TPA: ribbon-helix-helix domain-containing protein [Bryobacteraceae bacterium]|nr:ribbon-helix-helix domain-containing protein [Bryobacteraceae bacterium]
MPPSKNISISMPEAQIKAAERLAKAENRTMSELFREALRHYQQERRETLIGKYGKKAAERGITEADVVRILKETRLRERSPKSPKS